MDDRHLTTASAPVRPGDLTSALGGSPTNARVLVANLKSDLEAWLDDHPDDYAALVGLGELNLRVGLKRPARALLYRASILKPPNWEAYQRTALLLRRAEAEQSLELERVAGAPPPRWLRHIVRAMTERLRVVSSQWRFPARGEPE